MGNEMGCRENHRYVCLQESEMDLTNALDASVCVCNLPTDLAHKRKGISATFKIEPKKKYFGEMEMKCHGKRVKN